jgi:hypothetical protein
MKYTFCLLLTFVLGFTFISQTVTAQDQLFIQYTIEGVEYRAENDQFLSFGTYQRDDKEKKFSREYVASVNGTADLLYDVTLDINIPLAKKIEVGPLKVGGFLTFKKTLPIVSIKLSKEVKGEYDFYESELGCKSSFVITKYENEIIEGTFECELTPQYPLKHNPKLKLTKGSFRIDVSSVQE